VMLWTTKFTKGGAPELRVGTSAAQCLVSGQMQSDRWMY
jgi:hypothetical protein